MLPDLGSSNQQREGYEGYCFTLRSCCHFYISYYGEVIRHWMRMLTSSAGMAWMYHMCGTFGVAL